MRYKKKPICEEPKRLNINIGGTKMKDLREKLHEMKDFTVVFTKKDGSERKLNGTVDWARLEADPASGYTPPKGGKDKTSDAVVVWDLDAKGYRSIIPESVISLSPAGK